MNERMLEGKTAVITGASRGLGKAIALALAQAGARVVLVARDLDLLNQTAESARNAGGQALASWRAFQLARITGSRHAPVLFQYRSRRARSQGQRRRGVLGRQSRP